MSSEPDRESVELDAQLARLPQWQAPPDFAARLAAAAARQTVEPAPKSPTLPWLWGRLTHHLPLTLGAGVVALLLAVLPWAQWGSAAAFPWLIAGIAATTGLVFTVRLLRAP